jgi:DNA repair exonuclease SbcCD nuclease subunit
MTGFTFVHAADIHLDSPLAGLSRKDEAFSELVRGATRRAFSNVVDLAIEEGAAFVVIAGDLYDGTWKDQATGQFAIRELARLTRHGIRAVVLFGNHDAESRVSRHFTPPEGVYLLGNRRCETVRFDDLGVALHGRSYKEAATTENIAATYCPPERGLFNVALLHTALDGHEGHANYAPCSVGELQAAGHDYWALGHVHEPSIRSEHPHIVFPGNTQGRHVRETGPKGAMLVRVEDGSVQSVEHRACDEARWAQVAADVRGARDTAEAVTEIRRQLGLATADADGRPLAARVTVQADGAVGRALRADPAWAEGEVRAAGAALSDELWIERVRLLASEGAPAGLPPELAQLLAEALADPDCARAVAAATAPLVAKLPADVADAEIAPLVTAARAGDAAALVRAAREAVAARLGEGEA